MGGLGYVRSLKVRRVPGWAISAQPALFQRMCTAGLRRLQVHLYADVELLLTRVRGFVECPSNLWIQSNVGCPSDQVEPAHVNPRTSNLQAFGDAGG